MNMLINQARTGDIGALFRLLCDTLIGRVWRELQQHYQTVEELTFFLLLGMLTSACQDGAYVRMPDGRLVPLTSYWVVSAPPASGKSTLLTRLLEPFRKAEAEAAADNAQQQRRFRADHLIWKRQLRHLTREMDEAVAQGQDGRYLSMKLSILIPDEPQAPLVASWLAEDTTIQALRRRLHKTWPSACIVLDEGIRFFKSPLSRAFADFCTLHDARLAKNERITTGAESVENAFLSMVIATQSGPLLQYLKEHGQTAFDTGFLARLQLLDVRYPIAPRVSNQQNLSHEAFDEYDKRVAFLKADARRRMRKTGAFEPAIIDISQAAGDLLNGSLQAFGTRVAVEGLSLDMDPYVQRLPVLIARVAGVLHRFEGCEGATTENTMRIAIEIGFWLAQETNKVLLRLHEPSAAEKADIEILRRMLNMHGRERRRSFITKSELWAMAPSFGLDETRCKHALQYLCKVRWVWQEVRGNATIIRLSPYFFPAY